VCSIFDVLRIEWNLEFLSKRTQNRWKFVIATVRGGCKLWRYISKGGYILVTKCGKGEGGRFLPKIVWCHLWMAPMCSKQVEQQFGTTGSRPLASVVNDKIKLVLKIGHRICATKSSCWSVVTSPTFVKSQLCQVELFLSACLQSNSYFLFADIHRAVVKSLDIDS